MRRRVFWSIFIPSVSILAVSTLIVGALIMADGGIVLENPILAAGSVFIILTALLVLVTFLLSRWISKPLRNLSFNNPLSNRTYEELDPMLSSIEKKNAEIADRMEALTRQRSEFDHITANMSEGIVMISSEGIILSANKSAKAILSIENGGYYTDLKNGEDVINILKGAFEGKRTVENIKRSGKIYRLTASPVTNPYGEYSVVLLILDVTSSEQAESLRREFSANVSHELKTPLTTILGYAEIISNGVARSEDVPAFATQIHSEASRLLTLIEDIIKLSRLDEKNLKAEFEAVELYGLCEKVVSQLSDKAKKLGVSLEFDGIYSTVNGIRPVLYEIIFNLTDNALTYNKSGGNVKISLSGDPDHPTLSVTDTGIGIAKEDQERVFERFYRVDKSHSKETGGTGLGLSIVKHGVLLHGARLSLESTLGKGTIVTVEF